MKSMRRVLRRVPQLAAAALLLAATCTAQTRPSDQEIFERVDEYMRTATASGLFMGTVLVARGDRGIVSKGYGMADLEHDVPNTPRTKFDIASISKTFTATLILMLQEQG